MEYNSELGEGEACCYKDDHNNLDSDTALSSIDEKIQNFLGHFQRVFEGCVSTDELGARYGQHGSFLPMNGCSSPTWSHPTPQINYGSQRPPKSVHMKGHSNNLKAPENASFRGRSGNSSCSVQEAHDTRLPSASAPLHNGSHLVQVVSDSAVKDGSLNKPAASTEQRSLKFRFKMSQDIKSKKNNALYSGLGLDNTPSSSLGNSPGETGGLVATSREITSKSPTSILQVMTSFFIPGGAIVSPLHDSLLSLLRNEKERPFRNRKDTSFFNSSPHQFVELSSEPSFSVGKLSEKKNTKPMGKSKKSVENKNAGSLVSENENRSLSKKRFENIISGGKEMLSKDLKVDVVDPMEANPRDVDRDGAVEKLFSSDSVKEDSLESISGSGMSRKPNPRRSSVEKCQNNNAEGSSIDVSVDTRENSRGNKSMSLAHVKLQDISKDKAARKNPSCEQDDKNIEFKKEKPSSKGRKKLRSSEGSRKVNVSNKEILRPELAATTNGMTDGYVIGHHISTENSRLNKLKSQKDDFTDPSGRHFTKQPKHYSFSASERKEAVPFGNLKEIVGDSKVDNHLSAVSVKDVPRMVPPNTEDGFTSEAAAPAVVIDENWVQCDRCQKWRLLPDGTKTEQLPEKWLCSMLNWLPQMNRCDISEDDTTKALHELYLNPSNLSQNSLEDVVNQSATMVNQNNWSLNSEVVAARVKKKYGSKEVLKSGGVNGLTLISGPRKDTPRESVKRRSLNDMAHLPAESDLVNKSGFQLHEPHRVRGSKKIKTEDVFSDEKHEDSNLDLQRASQNIHTAMASGRVKEENECADSELAMKERLVVSVKNIRVTQNSSGGGSLDVTMRDKKDSCMRKRKLGDSQDNQNGSSGGGSLDLTMRDNKDSSMRKRKLDDSLNNQNGLYVKEKSSGSGFQKEKKALLSKHGMQYPGGDFQNRKSRGDSVGGSAEVKSVDEAHKLNKPKSKLAFQQAYDDGLDSLRRDSGCRQVATTANSSSSKISGSHKARVNFEEVKSSPVESVSSSPMRTLYNEKLTLAGGISLAGDDAADGGIPVTGNFRRCSDGAGADLISSGMIRKEKRDSDCNTRSHKISTADLMDGSAEQNDNGKTKSCEIGKSGVFSNDAEIIKEKQCLTNQKAFGHCQDDGRVDIEQHEDTSFLHKLGKEHASQLKDNSKSSAGKKIKAYEQPNEQDLNCEKGNLHEKSKATHNKIEKYGGRRDSLGQMSSGTRMENPLKLKEHNKPDVKSAAQCYINCKASPSQYPIQDTGGERKVLHVKAAGNTYKSASEFEVQNKQETQDHHAAVEPPPRLLLKEFPVNASSNGDLLKVSKGPGNAGRKSVARPGKKDVHVLGRDLSSQNPGPYLNRPSSSALTKGKELRELADNLKNSGFSFESNEANFKAALEFLRGASLSETCTGEGGRPGDVSPMQAYSIATKLCETCAQEYEKRKEMAATSLAYKCMEVAYMRVVYCKNPTSSRDRHELQATLMTPQGESPSSSASDVDNLNHQAPVDKGTVTNVAGTHIVARKRPKFIRLLDFMQDVSSAMDASTKSRKAFEAANSTLAEAQNKECITSVRKVIDFSFQDVEGLIRLVQQALEAISHSDLGGGRC